MKERIDQMGSEFRVPARINAWARRAYEFCAVWAGPALVVTQLGSYLDQGSGGYISALLPWYSLVTPILICLGVISQVMIVIPLGIEEWEEGRRRRALGWFLASVPGLIFVFITNDVFSLIHDAQFSRSAALAQFHLNNASLMAGLGLYGIYASIVGVQIRQEMKRRKRATD